MRKKQKVLALIGPTASGKSARAVELAKRFGGEVVSADSRQVYRKLDIGTGKITRREMRGVPHHLLDVASARKKFTAHEFAARAQKAIAEIGARGKLPILCGGTGFYVDAALGDLTLPNVGPDEKLRLRLEKKTSPQLFVMLKRRDSRRAATIEPGNKRRLIRALEIVESLGAVPQASAVHAGLYDVLWIGLRPAEKELRQKIDERLLSRLKHGMVAEMRSLHRAGLSYKRMRELGLEYRSLARFLQGQLDENGLQEELRRDIFRYAKKQLAYWKRNPDIRWYSPAQKRRVLSAVRAWLQH